MDTAAWGGTGTEREETLAEAAQAAARRGASYTAEQVKDLTAQGRRLADEADERLAAYTGKSGSAWIEEGSSLIKRHPWVAVGVLAVALVIVLDRLRR